MVFLCRWQSPGCSLGARSLFHAAQTQPALHGGKAPVSQSVPGLKAEGFPSPHHNDDPHTHTLTDTGMHASYTYAQRHIGECFHTHTHTHMHRVGLFLLHTLNCPQCPPCVYSWRPLRWYHLFLSQLHQPTPYPPQEELFFFFPHACTRTFCHFFLSVSFDQCLGLYNNRLRIQVNMKQNRYRHCDWHLCQ